MMEDDLRRTRHRRLLPARTRQARGVRPDVQAGAEVTVHRRATAGSGATRSLPPSRTCISTAPAIEVPGGDSFHGHVGHRPLLPRLPRRLPRRELQRRERHRQPRPGPGPSGSPSAGRSAAPIPGSATSARHRRPGLHHGPQPRRDRRRPGPLEWVVIDEVVIWKQIMAHSEAAGSPARDLVRVTAASIRTGGTFVTPYLWRILDGVRRDRRRRRRDGKRHVLAVGQAGPAGLGAGTVRHPAQHGIVAWCQPDHSPPLLRRPRLRAAPAPGLRPLGCRGAGQRRVAPGHHRLPRWRPGGRPAVSGCARQRPPAWAETPGL